MRILRVPVDGRRIVDLHPRLSVVTGLDPAQAARLRRAVAAIVTGLAPVGGGLVEAHGLLLDASQDDLDLLGVATDPAAGVASVATLLPGAVPDQERRDRLATAERDVLLLATDRRWAAAALDAAGRHDEPGADELARADELRLVLALHDATDVEPVRRALDEVEDARRSAGAQFDVQRLADALAGLGVDLRGTPADDDEIRRTAMDLLDEHHRQAAWAVGARVELDGLERRLRARLPVPAGGGRAVLPESVERRLERATAAHADAIARADDLREQLAPTAAVPVDALLDAVVRTLHARGRDHPSGTAPLVLDRLLRGLGDAEVDRLLDAIAPHAAGVQVVVLDDHPAADRWARRTHDRGAAVVRATPAPASRPSPTMPPTPTHRRVE